MLNLGYERLNATKHIHYLSLPYSLLKPKPLEVKFLVTYTISASTTPQCDRLPLSRKRHIHVLLLRGIFQIPYDIVRLALIDVAYYHPCRARPKER